MTKPAYALTRAVAYSHRPDGTVGISLLAWDGKPRLAAFPKWVQFQVRAYAFLALTPEESRTVWGARAMSRECQAAVWDDLLCQRATVILLESRARESAFAKEAALLYGESMDPAWVKRLRATIMRAR